MPEDRDAFLAIYRAHHAAVFRFARMMTGDPVKAAEVTQDVFVWLIHHPGEFDPARGGWSGFPDRELRDTSWKRRYPRGAAVGSSRGETAIAAELTWMSETRHDTELLRQAIAALPARYREVVALCGLEGKSYEEAAAIVGCAVGTVRSRMHRARALLARKLVGRGCTV